MSSTPFLLIGEKFTKEDYYHQGYLTLNEALSAAQRIADKEVFLYCVYSLSSKCIEWQEVTATPCEMLVTTIINCYEKHLKD